jgi:hypothetical protein
VDLEHQVIVTRSAGPDKPGNAPFVQIRKEFPMKFRPVSENNRFQSYLRRRKDIRGSAAGE